MVRFPLMLRLGVVTVLALIPVVLIANPPGEDSAFNSALALQQAMEKARHHLMEANSQKAVEALEEQLPRVNGHAPFLRLMREAYRTHVKSLWLSNQPELAKKYLERLCILEPTAATDATLRPPEIQSSQAPKTPAPATGPAQPPQIFPNFARTHPKNPEIPKKDNVFKPTTQARAKVEDDPFDPVHERRTAGLGEKSRLAEQLITRANAAWSNRRFDDALGLYEQAYQADSASITPYRDNWAYCMLNNVVEQLKSPNLGGQSLADLQQQVHGARTLAPKLDKTGQWLLKTIEQRHQSQTSAASSAKDEPVFNVQHYGKNQQGWFVTETPRFRIYHNQDRALVDKVAQLAERTTLAMARKWLGKDNVDWQDKCEVVLHAASADYTKTTGVASNSPGHAHIESDTATGRVLSRRLHLRCDNPDLLLVTLPHETTHVVLAGHFDQHAIPRWADEGIASLSEPTERVDKYRRTVQRMTADGQLFSLRELLGFENYPERRRIDAFYAQSVTLVDYLAQLRGPTTLPEFIRDALRTNYEAALQKHYSMTMNELQMRWQHRVMGDGKTAPDLSAGR